MKREYIKYLTNRFVIALIVFVAWISFFDDNSLLYLHRLNKQVKTLENKKNFYTKAIKEQKQTIKDLHNDQKLQKYAREKLLMKQEGEDIYLIDSNKENENN